MFKNVYSIAVLLYILTMVIFFGVYFWGYTDQYFIISLLVNAFVLPAVYTLGAYASVYTLKKEKQHLGFRDAFGRAFKPMFLGGFFSVISICSFLNYADQEAKALLNYQFVERNKTELTEMYHKQRSVMKSEKEKQELDKDYQKSMGSFAPNMVKNIDMFTWRSFTYYFAAILLFYVLLSTFFGSFFRSRRSHEIEG